MKKRFYTFIFVILFSLLGSSVVQQSELKSGYIVEMETIYKVVVSDGSKTIEIELTKDQYNFTSMGDFVDLERAKGH